MGLGTVDPGAFGLSFCGHNNSSTKSLNHGKKAIRLGFLYIVGNNDRKIVYFVVIVERPKFRERRSYSFQGFCHLGMGKGVFGARMPNQTNAASAGGIRIRWRR